MQKKFRVTISILLIILVPLMGFFIYSLPPILAYKIAIGSLLLIYVLNFKIHSNSKIFTVIKIVVTILLLSFNVFLSLVAFTELNERSVSEALFSKDTKVIFEDSSFENVLLKAQNEKKLVFLDLYTTWCGPCKIFNRTVLNDEEIAGLMNPIFVNFKGDGEKGEGIEIAKRYNVYAYPTLLVVDAQGNVIEDIMKNGLPGKEDMKEILDKYKIK